MPKIVFTVEMEIDEEVTLFKKHHIKYVIGSLQKLIAKGRANWYEIQQYLTYIEHTKDVVDQDKVTELEKILIQYIDIFEDGCAKSHIVKAYTFDKPASFIDLNKGHHKRKDQLLKTLEEFFFIDYYHENGQEIISVSRFRNLIEVSAQFMRRFKGEYHKFADLIGLLSRYTAREIAIYCSRKELRKYNLIK